MPSAKVVMRQWEQSRAHMLTNHLVHCFGTDHRSKHDGKQQTKIVPNGQVLRARSLACALTQMLHPCTRDLIEVCFAQWASATAKKWNEQNSREWLALLPSATAGDQPKQGIPYGVAWMGPRCKQKEKKKQCPGYLYIGQMNEVAVGLLACSFKGSSTAPSPGHSIRQNVLSHCWPLCNIWVAMCVCAIYCRVSESSPVSGCSLQEHPKSIGLLIENKTKIPHPSTQEKETLKLTAKLLHQHYHKILSPHPKHWQFCTGSAKIRTLCKYGLRSGWVSRFASAKKKRVNLCGATFGKRQESTVKKGQDDHIRMSAMLTGP